jgi:hypothetical protein
VRCGKVNSEHRYRDDRHANGDRGTISDRRKANEHAPQQANRHSEGEKQNNWLREICGCVVGTEYTYAAKRYGSDYNDEDQRVFLLEWQAIAVCPVQVYSIRFPFTERITSSDCKVKNPKNLDIVVLPIPLDELCHTFAHAGLWCISRQRFK